MNSGFAVPFSGLIQQATRLACDFEVGSIKLSKVFGISQKTAADRLREYLITHTCDFYGAFNISWNGVRLVCHAAPDFIEAMSVPEI